MWAMSSYEKKTKVTVIVGLFIKVKRQLKKVTAIVGRNTNGKVEN